MNATDLAIIRNHNRAVLHAVDSGAGTVAEIAEMIDLAHAEIDVAIDRLIALGDLVED